VAEDFEHAVSEYFWPALLSGRLAARVDVWEGRNQTSSKVLDAARYHGAFADAVNKWRKNETSEKLRHEGDVVALPIALKIPERRREPKHTAVEDDAVLLVRRAADDEQGDSASMVAYFRGQEMVIRYDDLRNLVSGAVPFHAVVMCGQAAGTSESNLAAERFLRTAEPPAHNDWILMPELKTYYARGARTSLIAFFTGVRDKIRDLVKPSHESLDDGPRALKELLRVITREPLEQEDGPRVLIDRNRTGVQEDGSWKVVVRVRLPDDRIWRASPGLVFAAETGGGRRASWTIQPIKGCTVDGEAIMSKPGAREMQFVGISDPASHPAPAADSAVRVVLYRAQAEGD
jgi:RNA polymerase primary sigma factor